LIRYMYLWTRKIFLVEVFYIVTPCHKTENLNLKHYCHESLKTHNKKDSFLHLNRIGSSRTLCKQFLNLNLQLATIMNFISCASCTKICALKFVNDHKEHPVSFLKISNHRLLLDNDIQFNVIWPQHYLYIYDVYNF